MNGISNNYSMANIANTTTSNAISQKAAATSGSNSSSLSATNIGSTFLNLLTQELQNQDPTSPMDSTAMVGQMISLNSLSQLIGINQTLSNVSGAATSNNATAGQQVQQSTSGTTKDAAAAAIQAAAASTNPMSYLYPMNQIGTTNASNISAAQSAMLSSPSAIR